MVFESNLEFKKDNYLEEFWNGMVQRFKDPLFISALYKYFMSLDVGNFDFKAKRPITKAYRNMSDNFIPIIIRFLIDRIYYAKNGEDLVDKWKTKGAGYETLYNDYKTYCDMNGFQRLLNATTIKTELRDKIKVSDDVFRGIMVYFCIINYLFKMKCRG